MIKTDSLNIEFKIDSLSIQEIEEINHSTDEVPLHCIAQHNTYILRKRAEQRIIYTTEVINILYMLHSIALHCIWVYLHIHTPIYDAICKIIHDAICI